MCAYISFSDRSSKSFSFLFGSFELFDLILTRVILSCLLFPTESFSPSMVGMSVLSSVYCLNKMVGDALWRASLFPSEAVAGRSMRPHENPNHDWPAQSLPKGWRLLRANTRPKSLYPGRKGKERGTPKVLRDKIPPRLLQSPRGLWDWTHKCRTGGHE